MATRIDARGVTLSSHLLLFLLFHQLSMELQILNVLILLECQSPSRLLKDLFNKRMLRILACGHGHV
jgi:hypothetical protein